MPSSSKFAKGPYYYSTVYTCSVVGTTVSARDNGAGTLSAVTHASKKNLVTLNSIQIFVTLLSPLIIITNLISLMPAFSLLCGRVFFFTLTNLAKKMFANRATY